jgi:hypothetical protein
LLENLLQRAARNPQTFATWPPKFRRIYLCHQATAMSEEFLRGAQGSGAFDRSANTERT